MDQINLKNGIKILKVELDIININFYNKIMHNANIKNVDTFDRDIAGLLVNIDLINKASYSNRIFAYVTESMRLSNHLWKNVRIHQEYDRLYKKLVKSKTRPLSYANLDDVNHTIRLINGNQIMIFEESENFLKICKSIEFASINFTRDIKLVKKVG